jgi:hypothetical protein
VNNDLRFWKPLDHRSDNADKQERAASAARLYHAAVRLFVERRNRKAKCPRKAFLDVLPGAVGRSPAVRMEVSSWVRDVALAPYLWPYEGYSCVFVFSDEPSIQLIARHADAHREPWFTGLEPDDNPRLTKLVRAHMRKFRADNAFPNGSDPEHDLIIKALLGTAGLSHW